MATSKGTMTLKQFMVRSQVLQLYRDMMRALKLVPNDEYRSELMKWVRDDFKKNKHHTEEEVIKMMITHGKKSLKRIQNTVHLSR